MTTTELAPPAPDVLRAMTLDIVHGLHTLDHDTPTYTDLGLRLRLDCLFGGVLEDPAPARQSRIGTPLPKRCARGPSPACDCSPRPSSRSRCTA
ncbi:Hypothetical protein I5071_66560 [Sandaracinus amylolyticus]|nr:Hypothetical protein I5071_66560 [Sandaracinus amylolyticus]